MTIKEFLISSILSLTAAFGIYYIIENIKERKWTNLIFITFTFILIIALIIYPNTSKIINTTQIDDIATPLLITLLIFFIMFLFLTYSNRQLKFFNRFKSHFVKINHSDINAKIKSWMYYHIKEKKEHIEKEIDQTALIIDDKYFINHKYLYQLLMPSNFKPYDLTFINQFKKPNDQIGIVHMIHQENYISWLDVIYWRILHLLSHHNLMIYVFVSDAVTSNKTFLAYLRRFLGKKVIIDDSLFKSLYNIDEIKNPDLKEENLKKKQPNYNKLRYFIKLSPLLLSKKHTFVLMWEGYYTQFKFYETINLNNNFIQIESENQDCPISINLENYRTEFLLAPTNFAIDNNGNKYKLIPQDTFLLGQNTFEDTFKKISDLNNYSLRAISYQVLCSTLPFIEKIFFKLFLCILILLRKDKIENKENITGLTTKIIAKIFVFITKLLHNRVVNNARI